MKKVSFVRLTLIAILLIQIVVILNIRPWKNAEKQNALINWDITSYYSYLPAVFVHQDLKFNFLKNSTINYAEKHQFWPETAPNGNKVIKTTMGMSVLYLPFFLVAQLIDHLLPLDSFFLLLSFLIEICLVLKRFRIILKITKKWKFIHPEKTLFY